MNTAAKVLFGVSAASALGGLAAILIGRRRGGGLGSGAPQPLRTVQTSAGTFREYQGELPIRQRVHLIQQRVAVGVRDPRMRKLALDVTKACPPRDGECESRAVYDYITEPLAGRPYGRVRYTGDVGAVVLQPSAGKLRGKAEPVDLYQSPQRTLDLGGGDCDDQAALSATLLALNGIDAELNVSSNAGKTWDHIFTTAALPKEQPSRRIPVDTTLGRGNFGKWPAFKKRISFPA